MVKKISKFCGFCGLPLEEYQLNVLKEGEAIFCSACGHKIDPEHVSRKKKDDSDTLFPSSAPRQVYSRKEPKKASVTSVSRSKFQTFEKAPYTPKSADHIPANHKTYKETQSLNKTKYKQVLKEIEVVLKKPMEQDAKRFQQKKKDLSQEYQKVANKNQHEYQLALLHNENASEKVLDQIKEDYDRIRKKNKKQNNVIMKKFKKHYKNIQKQNKKIYQQIKQQNRKLYNKIEEINDTVYEKIEDGEDVSQDSLVEFKPIHPDPHSRVIYNPNEGVDAAKQDIESDPDKQSKSPKKAVIIPSPPQVPKAPRTPRAIVAEIPEIPELPEVNEIIETVKEEIAKATKPARFDPYTGKPIKQAVKFDPFTGKPIESGKEKKKAKSLEKLKKLEKLEQLGKIEQDLAKAITDKIESSLKQESSQKEDKPEIPSNEVFTVLSPQVRQKLLDLDISSEEQSNIGKIFIYLSETQQMKYIAEIEALLASESGHLSEYFEEIRQLPIDSKYQDSLIHQLEFLAEEHQVDYVDTLRDASEQDQEQTSSDEKKSEIIIEKSKDEKVEEDDKAKKMKELEVKKAELVALKKEREAMKKKREEIEKMEQMELERKEKLKKLKEKVRKTKESS